MLSFICKPCKIAADIVVGENAGLFEIKKRGHQNCKGDGQCDCQHRVKKAS